MMLSSLSCVHIQPRLCNCQVCWLGSLFGIPRMHSQGWKQLVWYTWVKILKDGKGEWLGLTPQHNYWLNTLILPTNSTVDGQIWIRHRVTCAARSFNCKPTYLSRLILGLQIYNSDFIIFSSEGTLATMTTFVKRWSTQSNALNWSKLISTTSSLDYDHADQMLAQPFNGRLFGVCLTTQHSLQSVADLDQNV